MPNMTALWICARTVSGLTTVPQSTAQTTRRTRTAPSFDTSTSATCAKYVPKTNWRERQRLSPARLFRGKFKDGFGAGRLVEESPPIGDRILLRRRRQFVHEAFGHK